ncbi:Uncharacterized protein GBIM_11048 [Gryllus bimaculatus]|nr:Uncharacterized protein GBIM_11048 [Gryllus bimaculatus]
MNRPLNVIANSPENRSAKLLNISEEQQVQIFAKQMLAKRIFVGHYQERRYVGALNSYRDIVCVTESENDLPRDLNIVKKRIEQFYPSDVIWTGITGPEMVGAPAGYSLWVKLNNIPFGHYWFQIREVKFIENLEICVRLKCLRSVDVDGGFGIRASTNSEKQTLNLDSQQDETQEKEDSSKIISSFDFQKLLVSVKDINYHDTLNHWISALSLLFTFHNMRQMLSFLVILVISAVTGFFKFVAFLGDFSLRLMREISVFVNACTPIVLGIIDFFSKCVGGLFILITLLWRGSTPNNAFQNFQPPQRALPAPVGRVGPVPPPMYRQNRRYAQ